MSAPTPTETDAAGLLPGPPVLAGHRELAVYDGPWSEWGLPSERPVATGESDAP
ncbi:hypothetical protein [Streptomyces sp. SCL15-6]|uniref:hypothetical protein n=1 Tax=Streptomyces sp. SCL15-6 TaxID=2967222 RepID=UPI0029662A70|nr:hypothetical protein [Streptomyces sp. SCL15-6]